MVFVGVTPAAWADPKQDSTPVAASLLSTRVPSGPSANVQTPDGWTLRLASQDETQLPVVPLTTAVSSRDYIVGGTFIGSLRGTGEDRGIPDVGYDIGCGIDMTTSSRAHAGSVGHLTACASTRRSAAHSSGPWPG
jgi:hypothetical protein